jgi:hypothetical protein
VNLHTSSYEAFEQTQTAAEQSYEQKERAALIKKLREFYDRFGYMPVLMFGDADQAAPAAKRPEPKAKPEIQTPFVRQKDAIKILGCRDTLKKCEKAGWLTAAIRRARLVQYKRVDVMACVYRISQGEYP